MNHIYSAAISMTKLENGSTHEIIEAITVRAKNNNEARGCAINYALEHYPQKDGWYNHQAAIAQAPDEWVK